MFLRKRNFLFAFSLLTASILVFATNTFAQGNYVAGEAVALQKEQVVNEDYFTAGQTVIIDGTINGDAYIAGGTIVINGTVNGDVLTAGGNVSITGKVTGSVRAVGGQITITGEIGKNVTAAGGTIAINSPAKIFGSVTAAGGNVSLLAPVVKGVTLAGGQASIDSAIGGNVTGEVGQLSILPNATIGGTLTYWSSNQAQISSQSAKGGVVFHQTNWQSKNAQENVSKTAAAGAFGFNLVWTFIGMVTAFLIGSILVQFFPVYMDHIATTMTAKPWASLGLGFLAVIILPMAFVFLMITIIGIPLAFMIAIGFLFSALLNGLFISYAIGRKIQPKRTFLALLIGVIINGIIGIIPVLGWIWGILTFFAGLGAFLIVKRAYYLQLREKKVI